MRRFKTKPVWLFAILWFLITSLCFMAYLYHTDTPSVHTELHTSVSILPKTGSLNSFSIEIPNPIRISNIKSQNESFQGQVKKAEENRKRKEEEERRTYLASLSKLCQNDGVNQSWVDQVNETLTCVPKHILEGFKNRGWHMYCTSKNLDRTFFGGQFGAVMGCTVYEDHNIWLEDRQDAVTEGPVHELGHYVDYTLGWASHTGEFNQIFNAEQATFRNAFGVPGYFNNEELFAEAFWRYYTSNSMASVTPRLHDYLSRMISRL